MVRKHMLLATALPLVIALGACNSSDDIAAASRAADRVAADAQEFLDSNPDAPEEVLAIARELAAAGSMPTASGLVGEAHYNGRWAARSADSDRTLGGLMSMTANFDSQTLGGWLGDGLVVSDHEHEEPVIAALAEPGEEEEVEEPRMVRFTATITDANELSGTLGTGTLSVYGMRVTEEGTTFDRIRQQNERFVVTGGTIDGTFLQGTFPSLDAETGLDSSVVGGVSLDGNINTHGGKTPTQVGPDVSFDGGYYANQASTPLPEPVVEEHEH